MRRLVRCRTWTDPIGYREALKRQREISGRLMRHVNADDDDDVLDEMLLLEHDPVYTLGRSASETSLPPSDSTIPIEKVGRGGEITYHGPGQLVMYPILNLSRTPFKRDIRWYVDRIEEVAIRTLATYGMEGRRHPIHTGVWVGEKKLAAIGISISKWVTMHGMALNVCPDMEPFERIVPCGIEDPGLGVGSISEVASSATVAEARERLCASFSDVFDVDLSACRETMTDESGDGSACPSGGGG